MTKKNSNILFVFLFSFQIAIGSLFGQKNDPTELINLASSLSEKVKELDAKYKTTPLGIEDGK